MTVKEIVILCLVAYHLSQSRFFNDWMTDTAAGDGDYKVRNKRSTTLVKDQTYKLLSPGVSKSTLNAGVILDDSLPGSFT